MFDLRGLCSIFASNQYRYMKFLTCLLCLFFTVISFAQNAAHDKIYLNDGSVLEVNVKKVGASIIEYTYPNESAQNEEQVENIRTIVFASGRVQQFNTGNNTANSSSSGAGSSAAEHRKIERDKLAILPVAFYDKGTGMLLEDHSKVAQSRIYVFFEDNISKIAPLTLQDSRLTNAYLRKANIDYALLDETPVDELEQILGCEYLVLSKVTCEIRSQSNVSESTYMGAEKKGNRQTGTVHTSSQVNENKIYNYIVVLEIYKGGKKIYNETRKPFLNMEDSWKDAMEYMLKRAPIYKR